MDPIEVLCDEHRAIWRALICIEMAAERLRTRKPVRIGLFADVANFIQAFADELHHRKEEDALFPAMTAAGIPTFGGRARAMLSEHENARGFPAAIRAAAQKLESSDDAAVVDEIVTRIDAYTATMRQHMFKEDLLFVMARRHLDAQQKADLAAAFASIEQELQGPSPINP